MKRRLYLFLLLLFPYLLDAQSDLQIGQWKSYLPYKFGYSVTQSPEAIYYGTQWALMKINKEDLSIEYFSKVEGLSDIGVQFVKYSMDQNVLIVVYENSNIDLIFEDEIVNLNQIAINSQIVKDRTVTAVYLEDQFAYFSTGFGLVQLDLAAQEFGFTTFSDVPVTGVSGVDDLLIISTEVGLFQAKDDGSVNLADFSAWTPLGFAEGLPLNGEGRAVVNVAGTIYAGMNDEVYRLENGRFSLVHKEPGFVFGYSVKNDEGTLIAWLPTQGINGKKILIEPDGFKRKLFDCADRTTDAVVDEQNRVWYTDGNKGYKYNEGFKGPCHTITTNRPPTHNASQIAAYDRNLYVATGGVTINYGYLFRDDGFYTNENGEWTTYSRRTNTDLGARDMRDFLTITASPQGKIYVGTFWDGLIEYQGGELKIYDKDNSSLQNSIINPDRNRITDMDFDEAGNLWLLNHDAPLPLSVFTHDGEWQNFDLGVGSNVEHIATDQQGYKWIGIDRVGLLVLDTGDDLMNLADDRMRIFNVNNSALTSNVINDIAIDNNGDVWVGTSMGPVLFDCQSFVFDDICTGRRKIVEQNGIPGELLGEENVMAIAVDGGNRKWFGTTNGIFVQSADAETQVASFNESNSPLFDNGLVDIAIDEVDGEVYFATNKGILSYRGEATEANQFHSNNVVVFPNPVRPNYEGPIAIKGLAENANVKITDVGGSIVFETIANGGQAIWYGNDLSGKRAASGVYLVFSTAVQNLNNPDAAITKIMLVN